MGYFLDRAVGGFSSAELTLFATVIAGVKAGIFGLCRLCGFLDSRIKESVLENLEGQQANWQDERESFGIGGWGSFDEEDIS